MNYIFDADSFISSQEEEVYYTDGCSRFETFFHGQLSLFPHPRACGLTISSLSAFHYQCKSIFQDCFTGSNHSISSCLVVHAHHLPCHCSLPHHTMYLSRHLEPGYHLRPRSPEIPARSSLSLQVDDRVVVRQVGICISSNFKQVSKSFRRRSEVTDYGKWEGLSFVVKWAHCKVIRPFLSLRSPYDVTVPSPSLATTPVNIRLRSLMRLYRFARVFGKNKECLVFTYVFVVNQYIHYLLHQSFDWRGA